MYGPQSLHVQLRSLLSICKSGAAVMNQFSSQSKARIKVTRKEDMKKLKEINKG